MATVPIRIQIFYLLLNLYFIGYNYCAKILAIYPFPAKSSYQFNEAIVKSLLSAGHHVTFINPFPLKNPLENLTEVNNDPDNFKYVGGHPIDLKESSLRDRIDLFSNIELEKCYEVMKLQVIQDALAFKEKYDILLAQTVFMTDCYMRLAEKLNLPFIGTVAFKIELPITNMGNPYNLVSTPHMYMAIKSSMTFFQRLKNVWYHLLTSYIYHFEIIPKLNKFYKQVGLNIPYPTRNSPDLIFLFSNPIMLPRVLVPNIVEVGGIHINPANTLPKNLKDFIDGADKGVILFTFGSVLKASTMSSSMRNAFLEAFASIPQRIIWKYDEDIPDISSNVLLSSWIPQRDILEHENVIGFISHCGLAGSFEAIYTGTPVIASPIFADQFSNAARLIDLGMAVHFSPLSATKNDVLEAINEIVNNTK